MSSWISHHFSKYYYELWVFVYTRITMICMNSYIATRSISRHLQSKAKRDTYISSFHRESVSTFRILYIREYEYMYEYNRKMPYIFIQISMWFSWKFVQPTTVSSRNTSTDTIYICIYISIPHGVMHTKYYIIIMIVISCIRSTVVAVLSMPLELDLIDVAKCNCTKSLSHQTNSFANSHLYSHVIYTRI